MAKENPSGKSSPDHESKIQSEEDLLLEKLKQIRGRSLEHMAPPEISSLDKSVSEKKFISSTYQERPLAPIETEVAKMVFADSLHYDNIRVTSALGSDFQPYCSVDENRRYLLHIGQEYFHYLAIVSEVGTSTLVHQLTHIWQMAHGKMEKDFEFFCYEPEEMDYPVGLKWSQYTNEQQALIVDDWYSNGMLETDPRFSYIREHIRKGIN